MAVESMHQPPIKFEVVGDTLSVSALIGRVTSWPLTFRPRTWCTLHIGWATFLQILVFLGHFVIDLWANTCQTVHVTLRPCPLTLEIIALVGDTGLCIPSVYQVCISWPGDLDLWPWNWCALLPVGWTTFLLILVFPRRFVLDSSANTCQMDHVTLQPQPLTLEVTALVADAGLCTSSVYQVWSS